MRESGEHGVEFRRAAGARDVLHETVREFHHSGVFGAYIAALDHEASATREVKLSRLARAEYPILARRVDYVADAHPDNGSYFLAKVDPDTGNEILALPGDGYDRPTYVDTPDSLVWVCTVSPNGEVSIARSFSPKQATVVIVGAQATEEAGFSHRGRLYLDLGGSIPSI